VFRALIPVTLLMPVLAMISAVAAQAAANEEYCKQYAQTAVAQVGAGHSKKACTAGMSGARWAPSERVHFVYCMSNPVDAVENTQSAREAYLRSCGARQ